MTDDAQLSHDQLKDMTPHEIETARQDGRLADLLAGKPPPTKSYVLP